jgi:replicative DNA helicase
MTQPQPTAPPQDLEAEQAVLGAVLLSDNSLVRLEEQGLKPEHFYRESYAVIYQTMLDMAGKGVPIDYRTLTDALGQTGRLEEVGGPSGVEYLTGSVPAVGNVRAYADIVKRKAVLRWRLFSTYDQQAAIWAEDDDAYSKAIAEADSAGLVGGRNTEIDPKADFLEWYKGVKGLSTPYPQLTEALGGGLVPGDITVIGAWPGFGKTILCDTFVLHARDMHGARCHIYLNELNPGIRTARMIARMTGVAWQDIRNRTLTPQQWEIVNPALDKLPSKYEAAHGWKVEDYVRHIRRKRWDLCVIDSASRIPHRDTHELEQVVGALADVGGETGCHIILVVQLNLERCKTLERPMPLGRDLLGGGSWYRDARNILFVHRQQDIVTVGGQEKAVPLADGMVYADKATHGEPEKSMIEVEFNAERMRFDEVGTSGTTNSKKKDSYYDEFDDPNEKGKWYGEGAPAVF